MRGSRVVGANRPEVRSVNALEGHGRRAERVGGGTRGTSSRVLAYSH
jgi:hypothetical protein